VEFRKKKLEYMDVDGVKEALIMEHTRVSMYICKGG
jgi:hypothetical protein